MSYTEEDKKKDRAKAEGCKGLTALIVRSDVGQKFVDAAIKEGAIDVFPDDRATAEKFLTEVHRVGKPVCNGPVVDARIRHGRPVREFI
jgi:coenzyme F420-reducing hydrogenase beta subunit